DQEMAARVLVVDDEPDVCRLLTFSLEQAGFEASSAASASQGLLAIGRHAPVVVVLDVGLPDMSGVEVCRQMRADPGLAEIGILMLTALGAREDRIVGLEAGADDYVVKPFDVEEIVLRVRALARRINERESAKAQGSSAATDRLLRSGALTVDPVTHEVRGDGKALSLRPLEFKLLATLMSEPGRVFRREDLLRDVWEIE